MTKWLNHSTIWSSLHGQTPFPDSFPGRPFLRNYHRPNKSLSWSGIVQTRKSVRCPYGRVHRLHPQRPGQCIIRKTIKIKVYLKSYLIFGDSVCKAFILSLAIDIPEYICDGSNVSSAAVSSP